MSFSVLVTVLDRFFNDFVAMGVGTSLAGVAITIMPLFYNFYAMVGASFLSGIGNSMYDLSKYH